MTAPHSYADAERLWNCVSRHFADSACVVYRQPAAERLEDAVGGGVIEEETGRGKGSRAHGERNEHGNGNGNGNEDREGKLRFNERKQEPELGDEAETEATKNGYKICFGHSAHSGAAPAVQYLFTLDVDLAQWTMTTMTETTATTTTTTMETTHKAASWWPDQVLQSTQFGERVFATCVTFSRVAKEVGGVIGAVFDTFQQSWTPFDVENGVGVAPSHYGLEQTRLET